MNNTTTDSPTKQALFTRFVIELPAECVEDRAHQGDCDSYVSSWAPRVPRPSDLDAFTLAAELREYGCWDKDELADDSENWKRIIWIAAGNIKDENRGN